MRIEIFVFKKNNGGCQIRYCLTDGDNVKLSGLHTEVGKLRRNQFAIVGMAIAVEVTLSDYVTQV